MYHIPVDFNSMMRDPEERVEIARVGSWQANRLPALAAGDEVIVYDEEMEVHGTVEFDTKHQLWLVRPDWTTRRDIHPDTLSERDQAPARSYHV